MSTATAFAVQSETDEGVTWEQATDLDAIPSQAIYDAAALIEATTEYCWLKHTHEAPIQVAALRSTTDIDIVVDFTDIVMPRDTRTRQTLAQRSSEYITSLFDRRSNAHKRHGHRNTPPMNRRGDVAKKRRIAKSHLHDVDTRETREVLTEQLTEVSIFIPAQAKFLARVS